jgi:hypothetical protein
MGLASKCNITDQELADALEVSLEQLESYCEFFDSDPDDDWELTLGFHYERGPYGARIFSAEGAIEICNYLEANQKERPIFKRFQRWLLQRDRKLKALLIAKRVQETSSIKGNLVFQNGRGFLAPRACRDILGLGTRQDVLRRAFEEVQRPAPSEVEKSSLKLGEDFLKIAKDNPNMSAQAPPEEVIYLSGSGLSSVSHRLGISMSKKHRREWMLAVEEYGPNALGVIERREAERGNRIKQMKAKVKKKAGGYCELTRRKQQHSKVGLTAHHLYDQATYPQLADVELNLIAIDQNVHLHFHRWMGGSHVSCTIDDFEKFIEEFGNSLFAKADVEHATAIAVKLANAKKALQGFL